MSTLVQLYESLWSYIETEVDGLKRTVQEVDQTQESSDRVSAIENRHRGGGNKNQQVQNDYEKKLDYRCEGKIYL